MNFSQLHCFVTLAETGSFTEAAFTLDVTQSAVSHALSALERELGVRLIERNNKGVVALTSIGHKLLPHIRALLVEEETILQEAREAQGSLRGKLRLGSGQSIASPLFAGVLTHFQQQYPDIDVVPFEGTFQEVQEWINNSVIDVGFVLHPARGLESTLLTMDEMQVFVAKRHHFHTRKSVTLQELRNERWIARSTGCDIAEIIDHDHVLHEPPVYQTSEGSTLLAMVREGLGITILPRKMLVGSLEGIVGIPLDPPQQLPVGLAVRSIETASPAATLFIQTAVAWVQQQAGLFAPARESGRKLMRIP